MMPASAMVTFAERLLLDVPSDAHALEKQAAERIRKDWNELKTRLMQNVSVAPAAEVRKWLDRLSPLLGASFERARVLAELEEQGEDIDAARFLIANIFPTRADFARMSAYEVIGETQARLEIIADSSVRAAFNQVVGPLMLPRIEAALSELKRAVGIAPPKSVKSAKTSKNGKFTIVPKPATDVAGAMAELRISIVSYAQRVVGLHDPRDESSVERAIAALTSIEEVKRDWKPVRRGNGEAEPAKTNATEQPPAPKVAHAPLPEGAGTNISTMTPNGGGTPSIAPS